ncbi:phosphatase PAP2 family protein [Bosea sp. (in: a-proteobacteria)]|uniref:phosphatase PAP2 family protein n=1 Tax=Bosea sp. (in: a-proteobacteria) TaxID=1871050 RepID=UPI0039C8B5EB
MLLTIGAVWWAVERRSSRRRRPATRFTTTILITTALHHAIKRMVAQPRPDRGADNPSTLRTGRPFDAMPSGHAMHAGAVASLISTELSPSKGVWTAAAVMAATRVLALAHWPSGVLVGFTLGAVAAMCTR